MTWFLLAVPGAIAWLGLLFTPWRSWGTKERLETTAGASTACVDLCDITVLIPARDEAQVIGQTLSGLAQQGHGLHVVVIDDGSTDGTAKVVSQVQDLEVQVVSGVPPSQGWSGKLWALEQGLTKVDTSLVLLLDADISLSHGMLVTMRDKMVQEDLKFLSVMAELRMDNFWERLLMPAYVYFFKLLYPFALSNKPKSKIAAAAGGCVLVETAVLSDIGGFAALRSALIDDCTLAARVKSRGHRTWMGLTHSVKSQRAYETLGSVWQLVARSAFTQLRYSGFLLLLLTAVFVLVFGIPFVALTIPETGVRVLGAIAIVCMLVCYWPILRYYRRSPWYVVLLPIVAFLYLCMTWSSALSHWFGKGPSWKGRHYSAGSDSVQPPDAKVS